jgi:hypothetical protein
MAGLTRHRRHSGRTSAITTVEKRGTGYTRPARATDRDEPSRNPRIVANAAPIVVQSDQPLVELTVR